jgi:hypothetical protein
MIRTRKTAGLAVTGLLILLTTAAGSQTIFNGNGLSGPGSASSAFDAMKAAIGGVRNTSPTPQNGGFRIINWDAVRLDGTDANPATRVLVPNHIVGIPTNRFQGAGVQFEEEYAVGDNGFANANSGVDYGGQNPFFSPTKTFVMFDDDNRFDDRLIEMRFTFAGTQNQAGTRGFGAIFQDVEKAGTSSIEFFSRKKSLGKWFVEPGQNGDIQFLGVLFNDPIVTDVVLTVGEKAIFSLEGGNLLTGPADNPASGFDLAITDDFLFAEPTQHVPEPSALALLACCGMAFAVGFGRRLRRSKRA